jgi:hypothetical protein
MSNWLCSNGWVFSQKLPADVWNPKLEVLLFFQWEATDEQIKIAMDILNNGRLVKGNYATWDEFLEAQGEGTRDIATITVVTKEGTEFKFPLVDGTVSLYAPEIGTFHITIQGVKK